MNYERIELYFTLIDIAKAMKLKVKTKKQIENWCKIEQNLIKLVNSEKI